LMLVILTLLGVSMMGGVSLQDKMAGNTREKTRAFDAAQAALVAAQNYLAGLTSAPSGGACSGTVSTPRVCSAVLQNPTSVPWSDGVNYTPSGMTVSSSGGLFTYAASPQYYIQDLSPVGSNPHMYLITAQATGGNANAVAVVQSVYVLSGSKGGNTSAAPVMGQ
jgi:type IV pilus assembly protein PilX